MVTYNGQTTNFSGVGAPNPKLTIPSLNEVEEPTATILRTIVAWCNNLIAPPGTGVYASLTGPGETTTPGELDQAGTFTAIDDDGGDMVIQSVGPSSTGSLLVSPSGTYLQATGFAPVVLSSQGGISFIGSGQGASGSIVFLFTNSGDPNGVVTAFAVGDLCVDTSTPGLWISTAAHGTTWTAL